MRTSILATAGLAAIAYAETKTVTATEEVTITSCAPSLTNCPYSSSTKTWAEWDPASSSTTQSGATITRSSSGAVKSSWAVWSGSSSGSVDPASSWGEWTTSSATTSGSISTITGSSSISSTSSPLCASYTATDPPAWFSLLPSSVLSSVAAKWTGGPPDDWCYYTYSTSGVVTSTVPVVPSSSVSSIVSVSTVSSASSSLVSTATSADPVPTGGSATVTNGQLTGTTTGPGIATWTGAASVNGASLALAGFAAVAAAVAMA